MVNFLILFYFSNSWPTVLSCLVSDYICVIVYLYFYTDNISACVERKIGCMK